MKSRWQAVLWLFGGLLAAGVIYLIAGQPRGEPITLQEPPTPAPILVHVVGAVEQPGTYHLPMNCRVQDAIDAAGGILPNANTYGINLASYVIDGQQVVIPTEVPTQSPTEITADPQNSLPNNQLDQQQPGNPATEMLININTASLEELDTLPGIGPVTAANIIEYRESNGPFQSIDTILDVYGIGPVKFAGIKDLITIGSSP